jgi:hypothetical protein
MNYPPSNNIQVTGKEWREIRKKEQELFRKVAAKDIESLKWPMNHNMSMEELGWKTRENDCYDACIKIVNNL